MLVIVGKNPAYELQLTTTMDFDTTQPETHSKDERETLVYVCSDLKEEKGLKCTPHVTRYTSKNFEPSNIIFISVVYIVWYVRLCTIACT